MKKILVLMILFAGITSLFAQYEFTASVQNQSVNGTDFTFDVYMKKTGTSDINLGDSDFAFTFNNANFTDPAASVVTAATRIWNEYGVDAAIPSSNVIVLNVRIPSWNGQDQFNNKIQVISSSGNGTLIGQVKITNISNSSGTMELTWKSASTIVNRLDNETPWAAHEITGSGSYSSISDASLPIELTSFSAEAVPEGVLLKWVTESEIDNVGFIVERSTKTESNEPANWTTLASYQTHTDLKGHGNYSSQTEYAFTDDNVAPGTTYSYRLSDVNLNGNISIDDVISITLDALPEVTILERAIPNPFNPSTKIAYKLAEDTQVTLSVIDMMGRTVQTIISGHHQTAGSYSIHWNGNNNYGQPVASGTYLLLLKAGTVRKTQKIMLMR